MRSLISARVLRVHVAALVAVAFIIGSAVTVAAKKPSPPPPPTPAPPPPSGSAPTITIAPTATLEPDQVYANLDVTVTCDCRLDVHERLDLHPPERSGRLRDVHIDLHGNAAGRPLEGGQRQSVHARQLDGQGLSPSLEERPDDPGRGLADDHARAQRHRANRGPGPAHRHVRRRRQARGRGRLPERRDRPVIVRQRDAGVGERIGILHADLRPADADLVLSITASGGTFHTGSANASASASVGFNGGSFSGSDSRAVTILESSTGDTTPPSTPPNLSANVFGDGETWLDWNASSDNATPSGLIVYEVFLNGRFDQPIGGGQTAAILYADLGVVSTIDVIAVDGAGNRSAPATVTVDCSQGWCQ